MEYLDGKKLTLFRATQAAQALEGELIVLEARLQYACSQRLSEAYTVTAARLELARCAQRRAAQ